jgi:nucleoside-diphosphate-sugar epimerase
MRILVLGASGFLGSHIVDALAEVDGVVELVNVARTVPDGAPGAWQALDLAAGSRALDGLVADVGPDVVVNAAGRTTGSATELDELNTAMVEQLLGVMLRRVPRARLVHLGSAAEYGPADEGHQTTEEDEPRPVGAYGRTKLAATELVRDAGSRGLDTVVLRVFNPIGARMDARTLPGNAAALIAAAVATGHDRIELGPLDASRDFVAATDVASSVVAAMRVPSAGGAILNVGTGSSHLTRELVTRLATVAGFTGTVVERDLGSVRSAAVSWQEADISRTRRTLGWAPKATLTEAVEALWRSASAEGAGGQPEARAHVSVRRATTMAAGAPR